MPLVRFFLRLLLSILLIFEISALAQGSFTLQQVLSSPFPDGLVSAEHGIRVAWVFTAKGVRNLWVADGPDFARTARQVTHYTTDDGQPMASLCLTPDG